MFSRAAKSIVKSLGQRKYHAGEESLKAAVIAGAGETGKSLSKFATETKKIDMLSLYEVLGMSKNSFSIPRTYGFLHGEQINPGNQTDDLVQALFRLPVAEGVPANQLARAKETAVQEDDAYRCKTEGARVLGEMGPHKSRQNGRILSQICRDFPEFGAQLDFAIKFEKNRSNVHSFPTKRTELKMEKMHDNNLAEESYSQHTNWSNADRNFSSTETKNESKMDDWNPNFIVRLANLSGKSDFAFTTMEKGSNGGKIKSSKSERHRENVGTLSKQNRAENDATTKQRHSALCQDENRAAARKDWSKKSEKKSETRKDVKKTNSSTHETTEIKLISAGSPLNSQSNEKLQRSKKLNVRKIATPRREWNSRATKKSQNWTIPAALSDRKPNLLQNLENKRRKSIACFFAKIFGNASVNENSRYSYPGFKITALSCVQNQKLFKALNEDEAEDSFRRESSRKSAERINAATSTSMSAIANNSEENFRRESEIFRGRKWSNDENGNYICTKTNVKDEDGKDEETGSEISEGHRPRKISSRIALLLEKLKIAAVKSYPSSSLTSFHLNSLFAQEEMAVSDDFASPVLLFSAKDCGSKFSLRNKIEELRRKRKGRKNKNDICCQRKSSKETESSCGKKENVCKKSTCSSSAKEDPCKKNQKKDDCQKGGKKQEDVCRKQTCSSASGKKQEDPCKKDDSKKQGAGDSCRKQKCGKKQDDPCKKKQEDPCKKKQEDPCKKKQEDPCKKKQEDPCKKKQDDPCKKKQEDPCKKKQQDPCKKKAKDGCGKQKRPSSCGKKEDPCKKEPVKKTCEKTVKQPSCKKGGEKDSCAKPKSASSCSDRKKDPCGKKSKDSICEKRESSCKKQKQSTDCGNQGCQSSCGKSDPCKHIRREKDYGSPCKEYSEDKEYSKRDDPCCKYRNVDTHGPLCKQPPKDPCEGLRNEKIYGKPCKPYEEEESCGDPCSKYRREETHGPLCKKDQPRKDCGDSKMQNCKDKKEASCDKKKPSCDGEKKATDCPGIRKIEPSEKKECPPVIRAPGCPKDDDKKGKSGNSCRGFATLASKMYSRKDLSRVFTDFSIASEIFSSSCFDRKFSPRRIRPGSFDVDNLDVFKRLYRRDS